MCASHARRPVPAPRSDASSEILLTDSEAAALGYGSPAGAVGKQVRFSATSGSIVPTVVRNQVSNPIIINALVVGIVSGNYMPAGAPGALVSITILLFAPNDPAAPGVTSVNVALFPAVSLIVPLFSASAVVET